MIKKVLYIIVLFCLIACEEEAKWNYDNTRSFVVVDAIITNERKIHEIYISTSDGSLNSKPVPFSMVNVKLVALNDTVFFYESNEQPGLYLSEIPFEAKRNQDYKLIAAYENVHDTAVAQMAPVMDKIEQISIVPQDSLYRINYTESTLPSMMEIYYDWSLSAYCNSNEFCKARETFYTLQVIDIQKVIAPKKETITFPKGASIVRKKYSLTKEHIGFLHALLLETEWRGGLFDTEQGNVPTNFKHGTSGWFGVCLVQSDSTFFE